MYTSCFIECQIWYKSVPKLIPTIVPNLVQNNVPKLLLQPRTKIQMLSIVLSIYTSCMTLHITMPTLVHHSTKMDRGTKCPTQQDQIRYIIIGCFKHYQIWFIIAPNVVQNSTRFWYCTYSIVVVISGLETKDKGMQIQHIKRFMKVNNTQIQVYTIGKVIKNHGWNCIKLNISRVQNSSYIAHQMGWQGVKNLQAVPLQLYEIVSRKPGDIILYIKQGSPSRVSDWKQILYQIIQPRVNNIHTVD